ncbi:MAG TPA: alginate lyase family protein [Candidatus Saccharimonadales bacterium]|nr:alginate lyase family protein [Candidatus Saccharimonadales bacterium]
MATMVALLVPALLVLPGCNGGDKPEDKHFQATALAAPPELGTLFTMETAGPQLTWQLAHAKNEQVQREVATLLHTADEALTAPVHDITSKEQTPPSGDKHDYYSWSDYYHPDPKNPEGPYIRKDGERVPDLDSLPDKKQLRAMLSNVTTLSLAYYVTGRQPYADKVAEHLKSWFLNPKTRMLPRLKFAQFVRNRDTADTGGKGIIDAFNMPQALDAARLILPSKALTAKDNTELAKWFNAYLDWLTTSEQGKEEAAYGNNRTTWYTAQVIALAGQLDRQNVAVEYIERAKTVINEQVDKDGKQGGELSRTNSWDYSASNAYALTRMALAAKPLGTDLFQFTAQGGGSIRMALAYIAPVAKGDDWPGDNKHSVEPKLAQPAIRIGAYAYQDDDMREGDSKTPPQPWALAAFPVKH